MRATAPAKANAASHRVVIVGAGFGGLFAAKSLAHAGKSIHVTLIDRTNHHLFQPLLYQVATGILSPGQIAPAIRDVFANDKNVTVELGEVTGIDLADKQVVATLPSGREERFSYDSLIVAAGVKQSYFSHDEYEKWAPGMKTLNDALEHRKRIFSAFEMAEQEDDADLRRSWLTFVVIGGGPTGVEIAGQISELARRSLKHSYTQFDPSEVRVLLFDGGKEILSNFGDRLSEAATRELEKVGVEVHARSIVTRLDADTVEVKSADGSIQRIRAKTKIWAAGVAASSLAKVLVDVTGVECDRAGRIKVQPDCTLPGFPDVFVIGDMMNCNDLPGVSEVALQSGLHVAGIIKGRVARQAPSTPFKYRDLGSMAAIDGHTALLSAHGVRLSGRFAWFIWLFVHLTFLTGFKNRLTAAVHWLLCFVGRGRNERAIVTY